jgi:hypothetical protein
MSELHISEAQSVCFHGSTTSAHPISPRHAAFYNEDRKICNWRPIMSVTIDLPPDIEANLAAQAAARGCRLPTTSDSCSRSRPAPPGLHRKRSRNGSSCGATCPGFPIRNCSPMPCRVSARSAEPVEGARRRVGHLAAERNDGAVSGLDQMLQPTRPARRQIDRAPGARFNQRRRADRAFLLGQEVEQPLGIGLAFDDPDQHRAVENDHAGSPVSSSYSASMGISTSARPPSRSPRSRRRQTSTSYGGAFPGRSGR